MVEFVHWVPRLWAHGTAGMDGAQRAVYFQIINDTYLFGAAPREDIATLAALMKWRPWKVRRVLDELVELGKIERRDGLLYARHCEDELDRATKRIESARTAAPKRWRKKPVDNSVDNSTERSVSGQKWSVSDHRRSVSGQKWSVSRTSTEENQTLSDAPALLKIDKIEKPPYPMFSDQEGDGEKTLDGWATVLASLPQPEGPEPAGSGVPGETDGPGNGPEPPSPSRASPRQRRTNPRAVGTNQRAMGTNPRAVGTNPRERLPDVILPDGPEQVRKAFLAVAVEHGPTKYAQFMAGLPVTMDGDKITITAPGRFERGWINDRYLADMTKAAGCEIEVVVGE